MDLFYNYLVYFNGSVLYNKTIGVNNDHVTDYYNYTGAGIYAVPSSVTNQEQAYDKDDTTFANIPLLNIVYYNISKHLKTTNITNITLNISAYIEADAGMNVYCAVPPDYMDSLYLIDSIQEPDGIKNNFIVNITNQSCWNYSEDYFIIAFAQLVPFDDLRIYEFNHTISSPEAIYYTDEKSVNVLNFSVNNLGNYMGSCQASDGYEVTAWLNSSKIFIPSITLSIYNEMNLSYMDISNIEEVRLDVFCNDRVQRIKINNSVTRLNLSCFYDYMNLWFTYNTSTSYYRSLIPNYGYTPTYNNVDFFMIDLYNKTAVLWDVGLLDIVGDYEGEAFFVTKLTENNGTIEVIRQYPDIQNYVHLYLIKDETYALNIYSSNGILRVIGNIEASTAAEKIATLPLISFKPDIYLSEQVGITEELNTDSDTFRITYGDAGGYTEWVSITIYNGTDNSVLDSYNTTTQNFSYTYFPMYYNKSYYYDLEYCHSVDGCHDRTQYIGVPSIGPGKIDFSWMFKNGTNMTKVKKVAGPLIIVGTALFFPAEHILAGIIVMFLEFFAFIPLGILDVDALTIGLFAILLAIQLAKGVLKRR